MTTAEAPSHTVQISTDWNPSNQVHAGDDPFANTMKLLNERRYQSGELPVTHASSTAARFLLKCLICK